MTGFHSFQETMWTLIDQARQGNQAALNAFVSRYRPAVTSFLVRRGVDPDRAEDVAQDVFMTVLRRDVLAKVEEGRGKFRSYLISVVKNVLGNAIKRDRTRKRAGEARALSLDQGADGEPLELPGDGPEDETFDHLWVLNLVRLAMERLDGESAKRGTPYGESLRLVVEGGCDCKEAGRRLGKSEDEVRNYVHRARQMLAESIRQQIAGYSCTREDYENELSYLERFLRQVKHAPGKGS